MADFNSVNTATDVSAHASLYGAGLDLHFNPAQRWNYIQHQRPDEVVLLKCFDSLQGSGGNALFGPHVALQDVKGEPAWDGPQLPRESIEVRLIVLHKTL